MTLPDAGACGVVILVSGWRQVGKTTLLLTLREAALAAGLRVGGLLSVARFVAGEKVGIDLLNPASGATHPLATIAPERSEVAENGQVRTGHYIFMPDALAVGLRWAVEGQNADLFFVDELGPLELKRGEGWADVLPLIRARRFGVALVVVRPELLDLARERLDLPADTPVIEIDTENRDVLAARLSAWLIERGTNVKR